LALGNFWSPLFYNLDLKKLLNKNDKPGDAVPRFAYDGLDRVIHERARLSMLTSLMTHPRGLAFGDLKRLCALTDGNLNRHLQVLEGAKLVTIKKGTAHNRPQTICRVTALGRKRYVEYLAVLEQVLLDAAHAVGVDPSAEDSGEQVNA
jgi:DNA-binding MarR family transcriptional regulator